MSRERCPDLTESRKVPPNLATTATLTLSAFLSSPTLAFPHPQDKRITVLKLFQESAEPWLLKDMEKAASKKGVVFQAVKDVVQSLVDDSLVHMDKIGTSNWFWSFPGSADAALRARLDAVERELAQAEKENEELDAKIAAAVEECPETDERTMARALLESAEEANSALKTEESKFSNGDDALMSAMKEGAPTARDAANRWTDNVFMLKSWVEKKTASRDETHKFFKQQAEINFDTFDYVE